MRVADVCRAATLAAMVLASGPAPAQEGTAGAELKRMLDAVPDDKLAESQFEMFSYVDFAALEETAGVGPLDTLNELSALPPDDWRRWWNAMMGLSVAPMETFSYLPQALGDATRPGGAGGRDPMQELMGFGWFSIDRALQAGVPPEKLTVLGGGEGLTNETAIMGALTARDFELELIGAVPVWHRFEDFKINVTEREPIDPFGGPLGQAARVAVLPDMLVGASNWGTLRESLDALRGGFWGSGDSGLQRQMLDQAISALSEVPTSVLTSSKG